MENETTTLARVLKRIYKFRDHAEREYEREKMQFDRGQMYAYSMMAESIIDMLCQVNRKEDR